jgi:hypothetical protein
MDTAIEIIEFALSTALDQWKTDQIETINMKLKKRRRTENLYL